MIKSIDQTTSTFALNFFNSYSKLAKLATVFILYNISSAIPPAVSQVFLDKIIPFFSANIKKREKNMINGATQSITKVNFHEDINANIKPIIH